MTQPPLLKLTQIDYIPEGLLIRFTGNSDDFKVLVAELKEHFEEGIRWTSTAFDGRGGWLIPLPLFSRYLHYFANIEDMLAQLKERSLELTIEQSFEYLHLRTSAPLALVKAAYRIFAQAMHPDHGGDHFQMVALNKAYEVAAKYTGSSEEKNDE